MAKNNYNILVTTDLSENSHHAFPLALEEARLRNGTVTLLGIFEQFDLPAILQRHIPNPEAVSEMKAEYEKDINSNMDRLLKEHFGQVSSNYRAIVSDKPAALEILKFAEAEKTDLLIMASRGRGAIGSLVLGSVVQRVLRESPCPLLIAPAK
jgi:nucleotide-binding universal stress UspA family protein